MDKIRVAVVGVGAFGRNHARVVSESPEAILAGVCDANTGRAAEVASQFNCPVLADLDDVSSKADAAIIAVPTTRHAAVGCALLEAGLHVLVEKPVAADLAGAQLLYETALQAGKILQAGHLERFNPAIAALRKLVTLPLFFEIHRLSVFTPRSLDVDVVLDLMIHDVDILLSLVGMMPEEIRAAGISILSPKVDIANVRLAFRNGCVANLTASRVSTEKVRKLRLFQPGQYISADYSRQDGVAISVSPEHGLSFEQIEVEKGEPLKLQFAAFLHSIRTGEAPLVGGREAARALDVCQHILAKIDEHAAVVAKSLRKN